MEPYVVSMSVLVRTIKKTSIQTSGRTRVQRKTMRPVQTLKYMNTDEQE